MSIVTRNEFATLCGIDIKKLNVYVSRGKVLCFKDPDDGLSKIDTDILQNQMFRDKMLNPVPKIPKPKPEPKPKPAPVVSAPKPKEKPIINIVVPEKKGPSKEVKEIIAKQNEISINASNWDLRKKQADAIKAELNAEKERLVIDRMQGKLLPVELVETIIRINIQGIWKEMESDLINLASIYTDILAGGDRGKLAELIEKVREKINDIILKSEETTTMEVSNAVDDYVSSMNRG